MKRVLFLLAIVGLITELSADWLSPSEQKQVLRKYQRTRYLGGNRKMEVNPRTFQISYRREYGPKASKTLSVRFRNKTGVVFEDDYKVFPSFGSTKIEPGQTVDVTESTQIEYLLKDHYRINRVYENGKPVYEFYEK